MLLYLSNKVDISIMKMKLSSLVRCLVFNSNVFIVPQTHWPVVFSQRLGETCHLCDVNSLTPSSALPFTVSFTLSLVHTN